MLDQKIKNIIELMAQNEDKINQLYTLYAGKFSDYLSFWTDIAKEETNHGLWIRNLSKLSEETTISLNELFTKEAVETYGRVVDAKIQEVKTKEINITRAMQNAYDLENGLIESQCFKMFNVESPQIQRILDKLIEDTNRHKHQIKKTLDGLIK